MDDWTSILGSLKPSEAYGTVPLLRSNPSTETTANFLTALSAPRPLSSLFAPVPVAPSPLSGMLAALTATPVPTIPTTAPAPLSGPPKWIYVTRRFDQLIDAIGIRQDEVDDGIKKLGRVIASLNRCYWGHSSESLNSLVLGSWAKQTRVRPFSDIDVMFFLPWEVYHRFDKRLGNKQSQLLQEVRANLQVTYPRTDIRGDGQVVVVTVDGVTIEVVPAFRFDDGSICICDTNDNGRYKWAAPTAELQALENANVAYKGNARQFTRLLKKWQLHCNVAIKAFQLERLALEFLAGWPNNTRDRFWYDWMMRDFFLFLVGRSDGYVQMPGTGEGVALGSAWLGAAKAAYRNAYTACEYEQAAGKAWQEIFGSLAPTSVS